MAFRPNLVCRVSHARGHDAYGKEILSEPVEQQCAIVRLTQGWQKTSVRTDVSASSGAAKETVATARLLFPPGAEVDENDRVEVSGFRLRVVSKFPRHAINGELDHWQVDLMVWGSG